MNLNPEELRRAMRAWATGITVVTAAHAGVRHGMTVSSFTSVSIEPPLVLVSLQTSSRTHGLIQGAGKFGVTILGAGQQEISERFAGLIPDAQDRLVGIETDTLASDVPVLRGGLAQLECRVVQTYPAGTNTLFIGEVLAVRAADEGEPLVYFNRGYNRLAD
jgi:flavin reductase (DIM6/NTAB) family NADH-FMN oxidoreductase RutF